MDTVTPGELTLQEQINLLKKRVEALELRTPRKRHWTKNPALTPEEEQQAKKQIFQFMATLPVNKMVDARTIAQKTSLLRRFGVIKVRKFLDGFVSQGSYRKKGEGKSAMYSLI